MSTMARTRASGMLATLAVTLTVAWACNDSGSADLSGPEGGGDPDPPRSGVVEVELVNFAFDKATVRIEAGSTIRWRNTTGTFHTVTPDGHSQWSEWQTGTQGETFEVTFEEPGTYRYFCVPHRSAGMTGIIIVE